MLNAYRYSISVTMIACVLSANVVSHATCRALLKLRVTPRLPTVALSRVKPGIVHGATDEIGLRAVEKPVHVRDFHATILHLMGFDHEKLTFRHAGLDYRLTGVEESHVVKEVLA